MKYRKIVVLIMLGCACCFVHCAAFKSNMVGRFQTAPVKNYQAEKVSICFIFSHYRQMRGYDAIPKLDSERQRISEFDDFFRDALEELSNLGHYATFTEYATDVNNPQRRAMKDSLMQQHDVVIKMKFFREKSFANYVISNLLSTFSLTVLPVKYRQTYTITADVFDRQGKLIRSYSRRTQLSNWVETLLIFAYPFHPETRKREEIYVEAMHDIFREMETEKILK
jgi:hypothetical protein